MGMGVGILNYNSRVGWVSIRTVCRYIELCSILRRVGRVSIGILNSTVLYRAHSIVCIVIANNNAEHLNPNGSRAHALTESTQNESALYPVVGTLF